MLEQYKQLADESILINLTPEEISLLFYVLGVTFTQSLTIDEINTLANGLFETAQVMFVIAAQRTLINDAIDAQQEKADTEKAEKEKSSVEKLELEVRKLQDKIEYLQNQMDHLKR